jgi:predicted aconitase with swiveling domain
MKIKAQTVCGGSGEGEAIVYRGGFSFLGDLDPKTGKISLPGHELEGQSLTNKVFVFTSGKGSSGGPRFAWVAKRNGVAPSAMICVASEPVLSCGVIAAKIPTVHKPEKDPFEFIKTGDYVKVNATEGIIEIVERD